MARLLWFRRVAGAVALCSLVFLIVSVDPFLSAASMRPPAGHSPAFSVNRFRKGDRLPLRPAGAIQRDFRAKDGLQSQQKVPFACDPAFSPVTSPALSKIYGRCMA